MKTKLSIIALLLMSASSQAEAFDFSVKSANIEQANTAKWACKKCNADAMSGYVGLSVGSAISDDDDHSTNALGHEDGFAGAIDANMAMVSDNGIRTEFYAKELGSKRGDASIRVRQPGQWSLAAEYDAKYKVDSTTAVTDLDFSNNQLVPQSQLSAVDLDSERERLGFSANYRGRGWGGYVSLSNDEKTGTKRSSYSLSTLTTNNFAKPVDSDTTNLHTAINMKGANWLAEIGFKGSWYENSFDAIYLDAQPTMLVQAGSPDNSARSYYISGRYRLNSTTFTGKFAHGEHRQDESFVSLTGVPAGVTTEDLKIKTTDANLAFVSRLSHKATVKGSFVYRDRDNDSTLYVVDQLAFNQLTGQLESTTAVDRTYATVKLSGDYRLKSGVKLAAGVVYHDTERNAGEREDTDNTELWVKYSVSSLDMWDIRFKGSYSERDGSTYQTHAAKLVLEENELMRKYSLADRERTQFVMALTHTPLDYLSLDFRGYYALDDYNDTKIGLTESVDYGYDASANIQVADQIDVTVYGGYQWIDNDQLGSRTTGYADWVAENSDEFGFVGIAAQYSGLADLGIYLTAEYSFSYSESDTATSVGGNLGEYESEEHSFECAATYTMTDNSTVGLKYQYTDYQDSDYADLAAVNAAGDGVYGLTTMGDLAQDYDAHLIMATYQYHF